MRFTRQTNGTELSAYRIPSQQLYVYVQITCTAVDKSDSGSLQVVG